jgi:hypothetical protein
VSAVAPASRRRGSVGLLGLLLLGLAIEAGWLLVWPLSLSLSHNRQFVVEYLIQMPLPRAIFQQLFAWALPFIPYLTTTSDRPVQTTEAFVLTTSAIGVAYVGALTLLHRGRLPLRTAQVTVVGFTALFAITLLFMPGLFSQDLFGYLVYGKIPASYGLNPYIWPPSALPNDPLLPWVAPIWRPFPIPYGPTWVDVSFLVSRYVSNGTIVDQVLAYKVLATAVHAVNLVVTWWLLKRVGPAQSNPRARLTAWTLVAWNPLVLFEVPGNGHNDSLMIGLMLLGLASLVAARSPRGIQRVRPPVTQVFTMVCFTFSALVKYLTGVAGAFFLVAAARQAPRGSARLVRILTLGVVGGIIAAMLFVPWLELPDSLDSLMEQTGGVRYANALPDKVALTVSDQILAPGGMVLEDARDLVRVVTKWITFLGFLAYLAWEARNVWQRSTSPSRAALALALAVARSTFLYIIVVSVWVQTWYFTLPLMAGVFLGSRAILMRLVTAFTLTALPCLYWAYYLQERTPDGVYFVYAAIPLAVLGFEGVRAWLARPRRVAGVTDNRPVVRAPADRAFGGAAANFPDRVGSQLQTLRVPAADPPFSPNGEPHSS